MKWFALAVVLVIAGVVTVVGLIFFNWLMQEDAWSKIQTDPRRPLGERAVLMDAKRPPSPTSGGAGDGGQVPAG